jgi:hypothetical protein
VTLLPDAPENQNAQGGRIVWSPAGDELILAVASGNFCDSRLPIFTLVSVKLADLKIKVLYEGTDYLRSLQWSADGKVLVMDWNSKSWWMDAVDGKITPAPVD